MDEIEIPALTIQEFELELIGQEGMALLPKEDEQEQCNIPDLLTLYKLSKI
ncbi:hypothetical protein [Rodentibacter haemolyticus]|uniref:Uncharacterized protein n=1 Tax=Rodentibacter haemolyticus TaxID=2778911 RepID=A0ABX6UVX0_9PAST|nr:hypothetical protein [Rodentibacter haemolyticus]QPB42242.1 hypothetical protein IHV77_10070 [Rodentibacter haemolyticus]